MTHLKKEALRTEALRRRKALPPATWKKESQQLCQQLIHFVSTLYPQAIHSFLPILKNKEPDIWPFIHANWDKKCRLFSSRMEKNQLIHVPLEKNTPLKLEKGDEGAPCGLLSPQGAPTPIKKLQGYKEKLCIVVPLVLFDNQGHRLGYGKGHYDRLLACLPEAYCVGVSLFPAHEKLPALAHDKALDACITPMTCHVFCPYDKKKRNNI